MWAASGKKRVWIIDSANANSWATAKNNILPFTVADVLLLQEHKVSGDDARERIARQGKVWRWRALASAAHATGAARGSASGGCAVLAAGGVGIKANDSPVRGACRHRFQSARNR